MAGSAAATWATARPTRSSGLPTRPKARSRRSTPRRWWKRGATGCAPTPTATPREPPCRCPETWPWPTAPAGVVKIYSFEESCQDTNGVPGIQTSSSGADLLDWGVEECVAWYTPFDYATQRPLAWAQGTLNQATCAYENEKLWTSGRYGAGNADVLLLDGETGGGRGRGGGAQRDRLGGSLWRGGGRRGQLLDRRSQLERAEHPGARRSADHGGRHLAGGRAGALRAGRGRDGAAVAVRRRRGLALRSGHPDVGPPGTFGQRQRARRLHDRRRGHAVAQPLQLGGRCWRSTPSRSMSSTRSPSLPTCTG